MSGFLLIIPEGWIQLDWEYISNNFSGLSPTNIKDGLVYDVENNLKLGGLIKETDSLLEFKLIDDTFFLIRLG